MGVGWLVWFCFVDLVDYLVICYVILLGCFVWCISFLVGFGVFLSFLLFYLYYMVVGFCFVGLWVYLFWLFCLGTCCCFVWV